MCPWTRGVLLAFLTTLAVSCQAPAVTPLNDAEISQHEEFDFLREGSTSMEEVLLRFGHPSGTFDEGRILTFLLREDGEGGLVPMRPRRRGGDPELLDWPPGVHSLVLVFEGDVLARMSVVRGW